MTLCLHCRGPKAPPKKAYVSLSVYEADPFCSAKCAKAHYGVTDAGDLAGNSGGAIGYTPPKVAA